MTKEFPLNLRGLRLRAVESLSLDVPAGSIFGLLGPNGSGKSTTIKAVLGLVSPTAGRCEIFGVDSRQRGARGEVGYLPEAPDFQRFMTARELVEFHGRLAGVERERLRTRATEVLAWVGLGGAEDRRIGTFSKGMLQRVGLAQALVHDPKLVVLDEPTAGVDPMGTAEMARLLLRLRAAGKTILLSSHLLAHVEGICDRVAILHRGKLIFESAVADLGDADLETLEVRGLSSGTRDELRLWLEARGAELVRVEKSRPGLDQIYLERVAERATADDGGQP